MTVYQTNTNEYTAVFKRFCVRGKTPLEAIMSCLWKAREDRFIKIKIN